MNISNIAIRINKKSDTFIEHDNEVIDIFDFINFYLKEYVKSIKNTTFKNEFYVDFILDNIYWDVDNSLINKVIEVIKKNDNTSGLLEVYKDFNSLSSAVFSIGKPYDIGLDVSKGVDFVFLES